MTASDRKTLEIKEINKEKIDNLPVEAKNHILSFFGKIGTKDFQYSFRKFKDKSGQTKYPTFPGNLLVLCSYMERADVAKIIIMNLLWHIEVEETLTQVDYFFKKCLPIPVLVQDPHGQWIEANAIQAMYAAGDRNPPNMPPGAKPFGLVERLFSCYENPAHAVKHITAWRENSEQATKETMAPYIAAINNTCQQIIDCEEISDNLSWEEISVLPIFLQLDENFRTALQSTSHHIVRSGFLFSMEIFIYLIETFKANVNNDNVEDKSRPTLDGWWSRKSDALDFIAYPKLQERAPRFDYGIFKKGIVNVAAGRLPERLDFSNGFPEALADFGSTCFFGSYGNKLAAGRGAGWGGARSGAEEGSSGKRKMALLELIKSKQQQLEVAPLEQNNEEIGSAPAAKRQRR